MKTNRAGIDLIKKYEGLRLKAYLCPAGIPTIGFGHTSAAGGPKVSLGMSITEQEAVDILVRDLVKYEAAVTRALARAPNENQFSSMVSLCYNIGPGSFTKSSVARRFSIGDAEGAAAAFMLWNKAKVDGVMKVLPGLTNRRAAERKLFETPVEKPALVPPPPDVEPPTPEYVPPPTGPAKSIAGSLIGALIAVAAAIIYWFTKGN